MRALINKLPYQAEIAIVVALAFGYFIGASVLALFAPRSQPPITGATLALLLAIEAALGLLVLGFLWLRGWRWRDLGLKFASRDVAEGVVLAIVACVAYAVTMIAATMLGAVDAAEPPPRLAAPGISLLIITAVSIVNPLYEEVFVTGYLMSALKQRHSQWLAIFVSTVVRVLYHLYQGIQGVLTIAPLGLVFAYWFARTGRLWPVIVAHGLIDFVGLAASRQ